MVKDNAFPLRSEQERVSNLTSSSQHYTGGSSQCKKAKKKKKKTYSLERSKTVICRQHDHPLQIQWDLRKQCHNCLSQLINKHKSILFLCNRCKNIEN